MPKVFSMVIVSKNLCCSNKTHKVNVVIGTEVFIVASHNLHVVSGFMMFDELHNCACMVTMLVGKYRLSSYQNIQYIYYWQSMRVRQ